MKSTLLYLCLLVILQPLTILAQQSTLDSLERLFDKAGTDDRRMELALEIGRKSENVKERIVYATLAEEFAENLSETRRIYLWRESAKIHADAGEYEAAIVRLKKAIEILQKKHQTRDLVEAYMDLAEYQKEAFQLDEAILSYGSAQAIYERLNDKRGVVDCLNKSGVIHKDLSNYAQALSLYHQAHEIARKNGLPDKLAATYVNMGVVLKLQKDYQEALDYCRKAEEIYLIANDYQGLANIYNNIGNIQRELGKHADALKSYDEAIKFRKKSGKLERLSYTYNNIGVTYLELKKYERALEFLKKAENEKLKFEDYPTLGHTYLNMSEVFLAMNNEEQYFYYANLAEQLARKYGESDLLRHIRMNNGSFEARKGNYKKAYAYLSSVFTEMDTLDQESQRVLTSVLQAHFREKQNQLEMSELSSKYDSLSDQKSALEEQQEVSRNLIMVLAFISLIAIVTLFLLLRNYGRLRDKQKELENTNEELRKTTLGKEEKETLLKEIHHRVKNNLQIIKSLIRLQKAGVEDVKMNDILQEFEHRVSSMALVHESLYKSKDLTSVNVSTYYEDLVNDLINAYQLSGNIQSEISVNIGGLGLDTLVPLGLLTNEIISNSLKHAFPEGETGIIKVDLKKIEDERFELWIGDNGKGFNFDAQRGKEPTLGTELILALIEQLDGEYTFVNEGGAYYRIIFKSQEKRTR